MSKAIKKTTIALLSAATCFTAIVGILTNSEVKTAIAANEAVEVAGNFETLDGASIRITEGQPSGIRWTVSVSETFYDYVNTLGDATYYTLVNTSAIDEDDHENERVVEIPCTATPEFNDGVWTFTAAIVYDQLAAELAAEPYNMNENEIEAALQTAYAKDLHARAYVEVVSETATQQIYSNVGDTVRSIRGVATNCLLENVGVTQDNQAEYQKLAGVLPVLERTETQKAMKIESMYGEYTMVSNDEGATWTKEFVGEGSVTTQSALPAGTYNVYVGAKKVDTVTLTTEGKATANIKGLSTTAYVIGNDYYADFIAADGKVYRTPFRYATGVIDEATDMYLLKMTDKASLPRIDGYYIMKNDLTTAVATIYASNNDEFYAAHNYLWISDGFCGTFEGNGYGWKDIMMPQGSIFPVINTGGIIKNFSVVGTWGSGWNVRNAVVAAMINGAKMENVYVSLNGSGTTNNSNTSIVHSMIGRTDIKPTIKNCVFNVEYSTFSGGARGFVADYNVVGFGAGYFSGSWPYSSSFDNVEEAYYISSNSYIGEYSTAVILASNESTGDWTHYLQLAGFTRYTATADFATATKALTELPEGFNSELWAIDSTNGLIWK